MKKRILSLFLVLVLVFSLTACQSDETAAPEATPEEGAGEAAEPIVFKVAHVNAPSHPAHQGLLMFKEKVEAETEGAIVVDIYDSGVLGGELEEIQQVISGSLSAAVIMGASNWQTMAPEAAIEELPFMYPDVESARMAFDGEYGAKLASDVIEPTGVKVLTYWESGFRHFTNNVRPIVEPSDMQGIKFRTAESEIRLKMFDALDSSAVPMSFNELYTALQQGTVDGQENPLSIITSSAFYEVQDYLSLSGHFYSTALFIVNPDFYATIPAEYQEIIQNASEESRDYMRQLSSESEETMIQTCIDNGMEVNEINAEAFADLMGEVWTLYTDEFGTELVELAQKSSGQ